MMDGLIMDYQLTIPAIMRRVESLYGDTELVSRRPDTSLYRSSYGRMVDRSKRLALALGSLGVSPGDRVATLCWNHGEHLEAYFGIPSSGAVLHTLNLRLHPDDLVYIVNHASDQVLIVDDILLSLLESFRARIGVRHIIAIPTAGGTLPDWTLNYEQLLREMNPADFVYPELDERAAAAMCYTSGTTGRPKGVLYSHRAIALHSLVSAQRNVLDVGESDVVVPVVPMFHANAWGLPFTCAMSGAKQVFPGPHLDPASLLDLFQTERATITAGVPTIWLGLLNALDERPGSYDLKLRTLVVGGQAAPKSMIQGFQQRHGLQVVHAWGMTEMAPLGTVSRLTGSLRESTLDEQFTNRAKQGQPVPFIEIRAMSELGAVPWDGMSMGELEVRGPWVASAYFDRAGPDDRFSDDGWFRTGDIVTIDGRGYVEIQDRAKDVIKSGGEWISSIAMENALIGHPCVLEAAVIAVPHSKWGERPLAVVVLRENMSASSEQLREFLGSQFARWWVPDAVEFVAAIPRSSVGKFLKSQLRDQFQQYQFARESRTGATPAAPQADTKEA